MILKHKYNLYSGLLSELILINKSKIIVEIGVCTGNTTVSLCEAASYVGGKVFGIDCWSDHGLKKQFGRRGTLKDVNDRIKSENFSNFALFEKNTYDIDFKDFLKKITPSIDFAFIDACHSYKGILNDFQAVYPLLSKTGIVIFHDTLKIDGCREFVLDLRTKYYDGTYDIIDLFGGNNEMGLSILTKKQFPTIDIKINQICGSISSPDDIISKEREIYNRCIDENKNNLKINDVNINQLNLKYNEYT